MFLYIIYYDEQQGCSMLSSFDLYRKRIMVTSATMIAKRCSHSGTNLNIRNSTIYFVLIKVTVSVKFTVEFGQIYLHM